MAAEMINLHTPEEMRQAIQEKGMSVVMWSAEWCADCVYLNPYLPVLIEKNPNVRFYHMDRDENLDEAIEQGIQGIPSFIFYNDGKEVSRLVSGLRKTPKEINEFLQAAEEKCNG